MENESITLHIIWHYVDEGSTLGPTMTMYEEVNDGTRTVALANRILQDHSSATV